MKDKIKNADYIINLLLTYYIIYLMPHRVIDINSINTKIKNAFTLLKIQKSMTTQNFFQRIKSCLFIAIELYRITTCSLLILFIPQKCDNRICYINENLMWKTHFQSVCLIINFVTLLSFCPLYVLEILRENTLIKYLDVNPILPTDNDDVKKVLMLLPKNNKEEIVNIDKCYQKYSYFVIWIYVANVILSVIVIYNNYIGNQTISVFVTYMIFILTKLYNIYIITNTDKYIFYSAYLKTNIQYNDIDEMYKYKQSTNIKCVENTKNIEL